MRGPRARVLTAGETEALRQAFSAGIDADAVRIVPGPGYNPDAATAFIVGGNPAMVEGDTIYVRRDRYRTDFSSTADGINLLIHELAHVRQYRQLGFLGFFVRYVADVVATRSLAGLYDYGSRSCAFAAESLEGQAQMIGDYAGHLAGEAKLSPAQACSLARRLNGTGLFDL